MHQRKILLLENVATQAAGVREHLSQAGFQVAVSRYEADGLKRLVEWGPDVVLVSTAHPAGDFVEYCRSVRALAPAVRIIVTSSLNRDRLFHEHPGLQTIIDGVLLRPYRHEEITAMLAPAPVAPHPRATAPVVDPGNADLRAEFQRQLDARFLEVEVLKRHLEVATRRAASAPGLEWMQSENEHLRQGVEEARKKADLALAMEQLKRSEIEVKLDNLLRMKEDFEFRAQNELDERTREIELVRGQLQELRERSDKEAAELAALRAEMERALVEKEQLEERLQALESGGFEEATPPADVARIAALEAELSCQRALAAEGQVALADVATKAAVLEESLVREQGARATSLAADRERERAARADAEQRANDLSVRLAAAERLAAEALALRTRVENLAAECERLTGMLVERERVLAGEVRTWRERAETAALEIRLLQSQGAERTSREEAERRTLAERQERAGSELAGLERQVATLREELAAQQTASRDLEEQLAARAVPAAGASPVELHRIQELLEEVISRARTEAVDYARRDAELSVRLQAALDERRLLQERFDRASAEASDRERRSSSLLQSAIDHGSSRTAERANLPALVPLDSGPGASRRKPVLVGLAVVTLAVLLALFGIRRATPPAVREQQPAVPRPQPGASPGAAMTPREVWDRWTRSDSSGGVLVQATLRSEQELRAEVEADRARGPSDEEVQAEFARRLSAFRFNTAYYVTVYLKNLAPGYPAYLDDLPGRFRLRDSSGREVPAFLPPGHEKDRRIFSFGAGAPADLIYEASVSLGFDRAGLSPSAGYLQLVVSDVGAASRRVLTWELE